MNKSILTIGIPGIFVISIMCFVTLFVCSEVPTPEAMFSLDGPLASSTQQSVNQTSSSETSSHNMYGSTISSSTVEPTQDTHSSTEDLTNESTAGTAPDPGLMDVINFTISYNANTGLNTLSWTIPPTSEYKGAMVRVNVALWNDETATYPASQTEGTLVADVGVSESPNNRTFHESSVPCPPEPYNAYFYSIFAYDASGTFTTGVFKKIIPMDVKAPETISNEHAFYNEGDDRIDISWTNPLSDYNQTYVRYSTASSPLSISQGSNISGSPFDDSVTSGSINTPSKGNIYYLSFFAVDCFGNVSDPVHTSVTIQPTPPSDLQVFPGVNSMFLSWQPGSGVAQYVLRYNTTGDTISSETDGLPVIAEESPTTPGMVDNDHIFIEHAYDANEQPLAQDVTYHYAVFSKSSTGVVSSPITNFGLMDSNIDVVFYDDFEGSHIFCDTWDSLDYNTPGGNYNIFWGPVNDPGGTFQGNYYAFSCAKEESTNDCAAARTWSSGASYMEYMDSFMSYLIPDDLMTYSKVFLVYRYNFYTDYSNSGCWSGGTTWLARPQVWIATDGASPTSADTHLGEPASYIDQQWTGWRTKVVDITNYRTTGQTAFGFRLNTVGRSSCSYADTTTGGFRVDTVSVIGIP